MKTVCTPGAFDTKGADYTFLVERLRESGVNALTIDFGVLGDPPFRPDVSSDEVARAGGGELSALRRSRDKANAMRVMSAGLARVVARLRDERRFDGLCGLGGSSGTAILSAAVHCLPMGMPKLLVSTVANGDVSPYVGASDVTMTYSVLDIAGVNRISAPIYANAAAAIAGMVRAEKPRVEAQRQLVAASMFGNTTECVERVKSSIERSGYEVLTFHATGAGGRTMLRLAREGALGGLLDLTMTELADEVCGGVFSAGRDRISLGESALIPAVFAPGCVDMCNFGARDSVPDRYRSRQLYEWNSNVTLMRTNREENRQIGGLIAETANRSTGRAVVLLPLRGFSMLDSPGQPFWDEAADDACRAAIRENVKPSVEVVEIDANINDRVFADRAAGCFLSLYSQSPRARADRRRALRTGR